MSWDSALIFALESHALAPRYVIPLTDSANLSTRVLESHALVPKNVSKGNASIFASVFPVSAQRCATPLTDSASLLTHVRVSNVLEPKYASKGNALIFASVFPVSVPRYATLLMDSANLFQSRPPLSKLKRPTRSIGVLILVNFLLDVIYQIAFPVDSRPTKRLSDWSRREGSDGTSPTPDDGLTGCQIPSPPNAGKCVGTKMGRDESITELGVDNYLCDGSYAFGIAENSKFVKLIKYSCSKGSWETKWQNGVSGLELKVNSVGKLAQLNTIGGTNSVWEVNCGSLSSSKADDVVLRINASKDSIIKLEGQGEFPDGDWGLDSSGNVNSGTCSYVVSTTIPATSF